MGIMAIGTWLPYSSLGHFIGLYPLPGTFFLWLALFSLTYCVLTHLVKTWFYKHFGTD
jgi:Mg2+-importing ATPase